MSNDELIEKVNYLASIADKNVYYTLENLFEGGKLSFRFYFAGGIDYMFSTETPDWEFESAEIDLHKQIKEREAASRELEEIKVVWDKLSKNEKQVIKKRINDLYA